MLREGRACEACSRQNYANKEAPGVGKGVGRGDATSVMSASKHGESITAILPLHKMVCLGSFAWDNAADLFVSLLQCC